MSPRSILRLEGVLVFLGAVLGYDALGTSWWLFAALLLTPDVFMIGYLTGPRRGAHLYNMGHTYAVPLLLGAGAVAGESTALAAAALIWTAHIGMDRALGYGLKRPSGFHDTHLSAGATPPPPPPTVAHRMPSPVSGRMPASE